MVDAKGNKSSAKSKMKTTKSSAEKKAQKSATVETGGVSLSKSKSKGSKRKSNLLKLCAEMNKIAVDAVDKEVIKRFRVLIDAAEEDITKSSLQSVLKNWKDVEMSQFHESFHPYIKHYIFMMKRKIAK